MISVEVTETGVSLNKVASDMPQACEVSVEENR